VGALDAEALDEHLAFPPLSPLSSNGMRSEVASAARARVRGGSQEGGCCGCFGLCDRGRVLGARDL
jgi:hypothetical protein